MSQSDVEEFTQDLAETHPDYTLEQFVGEFKTMFGIDPTFAEKRSFQKVTKNIKTKSSDVPKTADALITPTPHVINGYIFGEVLGKGSFGEVYKCTKTNKEYAVKQIDESQVNADIEQSFAESISTRLNSKFIVKYFDQFRGPSKKLYVAMELCPRGDLRTLINKLRELDAILSTPRLAKILIQLLLALHVLHRNKILHRDLKPENVFLDTQDNVKLGDFGCSKILDTTSMKDSTVVGTPVYESPEVIKGEEYDSSADMWSLGVLVYELVTLERPFNHANRYKLQELIFAGKYKAITKGRCCVEIEEIIKNLLNLNSKQRPSADALLQHSFIRKFAAECDLLQFFPRPSPLLDAPAVDTDSTATRPVPPAVTLPDAIHPPATPPTVTSVSASVGKMVRLSLKYIANPYGGVDIQRNGYEIVFRGYRTMFLDYPLTEGIYSLKMTVTSALSNELIYFGCLRNREGVREAMKDQLDKTKDAVYLIIDGVSQHYIKSSKGFTDFSSRHCFNPGHSITAEINALERTMNFFVDETLIPVGVKNVPQSAVLGFSICGSGISPSYAKAISFYKLAEPNVDSSIDCSYVDW